MTWLRTTTLAVASLSIATATLAAQWTNRYPRIRGLGHHVYLEGYELPTLSIGPLDPAVSPDGGRIAFASRGWLWLFDPATGAARRLTSGAGIDSRPTWSPDGTRLAFVRDDTRETAIVEREIASGRERVVVAEAAIDLDPAYAPDGRSLYYASAVAGNLDIWRIDLASGAKTPITTGGGQELNPVPTPDGKRIVYLSKAAGNDIRVRDLTSGEERTILSGPILSMLRMALAPDGRTLAYTWPASDADGWHLELVSLEGSAYPVRLTEGGRLPLTPAWHPDGRTILFSEADAEQRMHLRRVPTAGGPDAVAPVTAWDWGTPMGTVRIETRIGGKPAPARLAVTDGNGHPLVPDRGQPRFDGQNGMVFFYSDGVIEVPAPTGPVTVRAVQGLMTPEARQTVTAAAGGVVTVTLDLAPVWDARAAGWLAGEHHFHLNYGGPYRLDPSVLPPMARAEAMDVLTPLLANLHTRFEDQPLFRWSDRSGWPLVAFGQEVRAHFLGHVGLVGTEELFWPWIWGPGYEVHGRDDRANAEVLAFARRQGGISSYVHPVTGPGAGPFAEGGAGRVPVELLADGVLGLFDTIELICLWSDEWGSMDVWYRLLNWGSPVAVSAGTDVMNNFYRTMAIGTTRVYVRSDPALGYRGYLDALRAGRAVATNGPMLDFAVNGTGPGGVLARGGQVRWTLALHTAVSVDSVEIVVNGARVARLDGLRSGTRTYEGTARVPEGGWIAARAAGGAITTWPAMDSYAFGHTGPIWIGARGSTTPATRRAAAADLLRVLDVAITRLRQADPGTAIPTLEAHFAKARAELERVAGR